MITNYDYYHKMKSDLLERKGLLTKELDVVERLISEINLCIGLEGALASSSRVIINVDDEKPILYKKMQKLIYEFVKNNPPKTTAEIAEFLEENGLNAKILNKRYFKSVVGTSLATAGGKESYTYRKLPNKKWVFAPPMYKKNDA